MILGGDLLRSRELLKAAPQHILYLDDRAENVEAADRLGILFDTVEKTAARIESQFDIPARVIAAVASQVHSAAQEIGARSGWNLIDAATQPPRSAFVLTDNGYSNWIFAIMPLSS